MRKLLGLLAAALLALGTAAPAHAAARPFEGSLGIALATLPPIVVTGAGVATTNDGSMVTSLALAGGTFATTAVSIPVTDPAAFPIGGVQVTASNGSGSFSGSPLNGPMPINGVSHVCLFGACSAAVANVDVPLSVIGAGGTVAVAGLVNVTVKGAPWTAGSATVDTGMGGVAKMTGFVHGPASGTNSTANASGVVHLVTPIFISTNIGASAILPAFAILELHFVPEPGTLMLLGSGLAGLVMLGRSRLA